MQPTSGKHFLTNFVPGRWEVSFLDQTDSVDRPRDVFILRFMGLADNLKFFGSPVLHIYHNPGEVLSYCFSPYPESHYYNYSVWG